MAGFAWRSERRAIRWRIGAATRMSGAIRRTTGRRIAAGCSEKAARGRSEFLAARLAAVGIILVQRRLLLRHAFVGLVFGGVGVARLVFDRVPLIRCRLLLRVGVCH